ncbi:DJ-1/PfpI family protein [Rhizobium oryzicola]|uniref:DJ-1/PfpI family protein n=1 Tax=Rhizobium oryzicola TaxID=1232668 RepID=A0ABT8SX01_9HYPH|nr:DJ-1/PfpI family protein [Rhizobium oryzicola]MDO1582573.1 DJ-1/PfpI family protein [Rhizobium oryzicola]
MKRRTFNAVTLASLGMLSASSIGLAQTMQPQGKKPVVVVLIYPGMILLDLTGPLTCFNMMMADVHLAWKTNDPVKTDTGISIAPTTTFAQCPQDADILFVPGGLGGTTAMIEDQEVLDFVQARGSNATYITSVCTGSLVLGAAGLLQGKRATSHWYTRDLLPIFGATPVSERVVVDGNVITGAGVTAGLDFGLAIAAKLLGEDAAKSIQLLLEYDPEPPFTAGSPEKAGHDLTAALLKRRKPALDGARAAAERWHPRTKL